MISMFITLRCHQLHTKANSKEGNIERETALEDCAGKTHSVKFFIARQRTHTLATQSVRRVQSHADRGSFQLCASSSSAASNRVDIAEAIIDDGCEPVRHCGLNEPRKENKIAHWRLRIGFPSFPILNKRLLANPVAHLRNSSHGHVDFLEDFFNGRLRYVHGNLRQCVSDQVHCIAAR